jgi:CheY-like chemotaxis protein
MPVMGGIESSLEIRKLERSRNKANGDYKKSLIVALTGLATQSDQQEAYEAGIDSFMVKPVRFKELDKWLEQVV